MLWDTIHLLIDISNFEWKGLKFASQTTFHYSLEPYKLAFKFMAQFKPNSSLACATV
jgi:hypothetical protein